LWKLSVASTWILGRRSLSYWENNSLEARVLLVQDCGSRKDYMIPYILMNSITLQDIEFFLAIDIMN
jgi:hypothetical protein